MGELIELSQEILVAGEKSDQELIDEGAEIISASGRSSRELGSWFNKVKVKRVGVDKSFNKKLKLSAAEVVRRANANRAIGTDPISYGSAANYGLTVEAFPSAELQRKLSFSTCYAMLPVRNIMRDPEAEDPNERFDRWHYEVSVGICPETDPSPDYNYASTNGDPLIGKDLTRQIAIATDNLKLVGSDKVAGVTTYSVANLDPIFKALGLPKTAEAKLRAGFAQEVKRIEQEIHGHFIDEVNAAADAIADQRTVDVRQAAEDQRLASTAARLKHEKGMKVLDARERRLPKFMDKKEFKFIQGCLHSDHIPDDMKKRFESAYIIFNRLAEGGDW